jgi:DDE superfamily endonuclease
VQRWRARHKRFHFHFTPTSSWLNLVERWFRELTDKALRRGSFNSVPDLIAAIEDYLAAHNNDPKPCKWADHRRLHPGKYAAAGSRSNKPSINDETHH